MSDRMLRAVYPLFRVLLPNQVIESDALARAMIDVVVAGEATQQVLENRDIRAMGETRVS